MVGQCMAHAPGNTFGGGAKLTYNQKIFDQHFHLLDGVVSSYAKQHSDRKTSLKAMIFYFIVLLVIFSRDLKSLLVNQNLKFPPKGAICTIATVQK